MGTWGVAVFSDDLAADLRDDFRDLIGEGLSATEAVEKLLGQYKSSLEDDDESLVFWIALALTQWKLGRLEERTKQEALRAIESGQDLRRWDDARNRKKRAAVLEKARAQLLSPQPPAKRVPRRIKAANDWQVGELVGLRLQSGNWTPLRVIGHHTDKGGRYAICELLDWVGDEIPPAERLAEMPIMNRRGSGPPKICQFMLGQARKKQDQARLRRLGIISTPSQKPGGYAVLIWPRLDWLLEDIFGIK